MSVLSCGFADFRMAYGMGRPAIIREDETIHNCRKLLEHPLSITSEKDTRDDLQLSGILTLNNR